MSPKAQAQKDFKQGLGIDENPYPKDSPEWHRYRDEWWNLYLLELEAEQQPNFA